MAVVLKYTVVSETLLVFPSNTAWILSNSFWVDLAVFRCLTDVNWFFANNTPLIVFGKRELVTLLNIHSITACHVFNLEAEVLPAVWVPDDWEVTTFVFWFVSLWIINQTTAAGRPGSRPSSQSQVASSDLKSSPAPGPGWLLGNSLLCWFGSVQARGRPLLLGTWPLPTSCQGSGDRKCALLSDPSQTPAAPGCEGIDDVVLTEQKHTPRKYHLII